MTTKRTKQLVARFESLELDAMLVTNEINVTYLSGFTGDGSSLLVEPSESTLLSDGRYETQIKEECPELGCAIRPPSQSLIELIQAVVGSKTLIRVGIEAADLNVQQYRVLQRALPDVTWVETSGEVERLRMIKDAEEIEIIREAVRIAERAYQSVIPKLTPRWTEREVAFELEATMRVLGAEGVSFKPIVGAEPSGALPHYVPRQIELGQAASVLIDWGASYHGYMSDLTRTLYSQRVSAKFRDDYRAVLESQLAAIDSIRPGVHVKDVDAIARRSLAEAGLEEAFKHGLGHGIGRQIHEAPRLSAAGQETLESGMVITVEPGVYFEDRYGIRIEDDVLITDSGCEVLSSLPKGLDETPWML